MLRHHAQPYPRLSRFVVGLAACSMITPVGALLKVSVLRKMFTLLTVPTSVPAYGEPGWYSISLV